MGRPCSHESSHDLGERPNMSMERREASRECECLEYGESAKRAAMRGFLHTQYVTGSHTPQVCKKLRFLHAANIRSPALLRIAPSRSSFLRKLMFGETFFIGSLHPVRNLKLLQNALESIRVLFLVKKLHKR